MHSFFNYFSTFANRTFRKKRATISNIHVQFSANRLPADGCTNCIKYVRSGDSIIANLGLLKVKHRYLIHLRIPTTLFGENDIGHDFVTDETPNRHCQVVEVIGFTHGEEELFEMKVELFTNKEKQLRETLTIFNPRKSIQRLMLTLSARVLALDMSSPLLHEGIHCIGGEVHEDEMEAAPLRRGSMS